MNAWVWLRSEWDRVAGYGLVVLGAISLFLGYRGMRGTPFLADELVYLLTGGLGGLFCLGLGVGLFISADLRDEWRKLDRIESAIRGDAGPDTATLLKLLKADTEQDGPPSRVSEPMDSRFDGRRTGAPAGAAVHRADGRALMAGGAAVVPSPTGREDGLHRIPVVALPLLLLPAGLIGAGWRQAARTGDVGVAGRGVALGAVGLAAALTIIALATFAIRYRVTRREARVFRSYLVERILPAIGEPAGTTASRRASAGPASDPDSVFVGPGLSRFHRANCPALSRLDATAARRVDVAASHAPCGICRP